MNEFNDAVRDKNQKATKIPLLFDYFESSEKIAKELIRKYHSELASARIKYICRNKATKKGGRPVPGNVYKMSNKFEFLVGCDFVLEIALEVWNDLDPHQRTALIDHLLTRCIGVENPENGEMKWKVVPPEVQEFTEVVERHGQWHAGLIEMRRAFK
jgi:hypothetical protein